MVRALVINLHYIIEQHQPLGFRLCLLRHMSAVSRKSILVITTIDVYRHPSSHIRHWRLNYTSVYHYDQVLRAFDYFSIDMSSISGDEYSVISVSTCKYAYKYKVDEGYRLVSTCVVWLLRSMCLAQYLILYVVNRALWYRPGWSKTW